MHQQTIPPPPSEPVSRELSRDEALRLLGETTFGRIMFVSRAMPALRFVAHAVDGDGILVALPPEPEIAALLRQVSRVVYQADVLEADTRLGWSVVLTGRAGLVEDPGEVERARARLRPWPGERAVVVVRLHPELVTGFQVSAATPAVSAVRERVIKPLSRAESLERLRGVSLGRLVFTYQALPDIRPVNHIVDKGHVIIRSHVGAAAVSAIDGLVTVVAYEADDIDPVTHVGWSVIIKGTAELVKNPGDIVRYQRMLRPWVSREMNHVIRVKPEIVTGIELIPGGTDP